MKTVLATLLLALTVAGCSGVEDRVRDTASDAASSAGCAVAQKTMDQVAAQARSAVDGLGADPAAAEQKLRALRDTVQAAESGLSGEQKARLEEARTALDDLVTVAQQESKGTAVDSATVTAARDDLDQAVTGLTQVC